MEKGFWICWLFYLPFSPAITVQVGLGLGAIKVRLTDSVVQCRAVQQQSAGLPVGLPVFQLYQYIQYVDLTVSCTVITCSSYSSDLRRAFVTCIKRWSCRRAFTSRDVHTSTWTNSQDGYP